MEPEKLLPHDTSATKSDISPPKAQSWGAVMAIIIIVLMITIGAFYSWSKRVVEENAPIESQKILE